WLGGLVIASIHGAMPAGQANRGRLAWHPPGRRPCCARRVRARQDGAMADLKDRLREDLTASMKARDEVRTRTLRMVLTSVSKEEVAGSAARELNDDEVMNVLTQEAK